MPPTLQGQVERVNRTLAQTFLASLPLLRRRAAPPPTAACRPRCPAADVATPCGRVRQMGTRLQHQAATSGDCDGRPLGTLVDRRDPHPAGPRGGAALDAAGKRPPQDPQGRHPLRHLHLHCAEINGRVGEWVTVRYMPHDPRKVEVYKDAACSRQQNPNTCSPARRTRPRSSPPRRVDAQKLPARQQRAVASTRIRVAPVTGPGAVEETTVISREQGRVEQRRRRRPSSPPGPR